MRRSPRPSDVTGLRPRLSSDLTTAMAITAPSLYTAFGDKERLLLEAERLYAGDPDVDWTRRRQSYTPPRRCCGQCDRLRGRLHSERLPLRSVPRRPRLLRGGGGAGARRRVPAGSHRARRAGLRGWRRRLFALVVGITRVGTTTSRFIGRWVHAQRDALAPRTPASLGSPSSSSRTGRTSASTRRRDQGHRRSEPQAFQPFEKASVPEDAGLRTQRIGRAGVTTSA